MADVLYVGLQDDDKIVSFDVDASAGKLIPRTERPAAGAPSVFAVSPDKRVLYVGYRGTPAIESWRIDSGSGALTSLGASRPSIHRRISPPTAPATTFCPPTTRARTRPCTRSEATARSASLGSIGKTPRQERTRS